MAAAAAAAAIAAVVVVVGGRNEPKDLGHDAGQLSGLWGHAKLLLDLYHVVQRHEQNGRIQVGPHGQFGSNRVYRQCLFQTRVTELMMMMMMNAGVAVVVVVVAHDALQMKR